MAQCSYRAMGWVTVSFLVDAYSFPPILLVVQFHGGAICRFYFLQKGTPRQTTKITLFVLGKESDVPKFEFLSLFCVIPCPFCSVFAYAKQIVKCIHSSINDRPIKFAGLRSKTKIDKEFRNISFHRRLFCCWGIGLAEAVQHLLKAREKFLRPRYFCGVCIRVQKDCLVNRRDCTRNAPSLNLLSSTVVSSPDASGKACEEANSCHEWGVL